MGSHRHLRFPSMSFIYKCSFRKPEWCFCFSRFGEESFFASTVTRLKPALSVFSIAIELKLIIACKGTDNKLVSQDGFHRTLTVFRSGLASLCCDDSHSFGFCRCRTLCAVSHRRRKASALAADCRHCDCGCLFLTSCLGNWFPRLLFLFSSTVFIFNPRIFSLVLFAGHPDDKWHKLYPYV